MMGEGLEGRRSFSLFSHRLRLQLETPSAKSPREPLNRARL
jgi:hypothetical protein